MTTYTTEQIAALTDDELRREIAERHGYKCTIGNWSSIIGHLPCDALGTQVFVINSPEGYGIESSQISEAKAWDYAFQNCDIPNWPGDANAALKLVENEMVDLARCTSIDGKWTEWMAIFPHQIHASNPSAPRAICEAWLAWKQVQED